MTDLNTLAADCLARARGWHPELFDRSHAEVLLHLALGANEEAGEVAGPIKKWDRHRNYGRLDDVRGEVAPEIVDVLMYVLQLAAFLGIDVDQAFAAKVAQNNVRWPT